MYQYEIEGTNSIFLQLLWSMNQTAAEILQKFRQEFHNIIEELLEQNASVNKSVVKVGRFNQERVPYEHVRIMLIIDNFNSCL